MQTTNEKYTSWLTRPVSSSWTLSWSVLIFSILIILGFLTRFYDLESRVMSHDENSHVYYSWRLSEGNGYQHTPLTHGPLLFHLTGFSYFLFGDNDFTARIPFALFSIAAIAFLWKYRRYLGLSGALIAAVLMLISPFMLYYGRYVRNEALVGLFGVITLWSILRYLETGEDKYTFWLVGATALHFAAKETSFIYTAQALVFLGLVFIYQITKIQKWELPQYRKIFILTVIIAFLMFAISIGINTIAGSPPPATAESTETSISGYSPITLIPMAISGLALLLALYFALRGLTWGILRKNRAFSLMILLFTLVLPHLAAFPVRMVGWNPMEYETWTGILRVAVFLIPLALISVGVGMVWNPKLWLINAAIFYIPFTILYTTVFTNGQGFFTGLVGSLGYWLEQQGVERGSQPWYYYGFLQIPVYEFLPAIGCLIAAYLLIFRKPKQETQKSNGESWEAAANPDLPAYLLAFWSATSLLAYTVAGEKMPWLTYHIALPMILLAGWAFGKLVDKINWYNFLRNRGLLLFTLMIIMVVSLSALASSILGPDRPFQGREVSQLNNTNIFITSLLVVLASGWGVFRLLETWDLEQVGLIGLVTFLLFLGVVTARASFRAAYINYDLATEYLVYAHSARGPKEALAQIEELSLRTTDGLGIVVAYDDETTYPYWWYLRNYPNAKYYGDSPTRELREAPAILVGDNNFAKIEPVVGQAYYRFDYIRIWWPNQDYYNITWERIFSAITNPEMRRAIFQIWYNRDYSLYAELTGKDLSLPNWEPSDRMRLYVRKDVAAQVWNYGVSPTFTEELIADPYENKDITLPAELTIGSNGSAPGEFNKPRDIAFSPDGTFYITDTGNHRIQHLNVSGELLHIWGSFADRSQGDSPPGSFYDPWGIAVDDDGFVYVADTWNHRVQKFSPEGQYITQWGYFGQGESGEAFWGPRDIVYFPEGYLLITDTGNKRVAVFDTNGNFISEFGSAGLLEGQFDEPVGLAMDSEGRIFVADTWNQRVQVFLPDFTNMLFTFVREWEIVGWYGQSLENKPYLTVDSNGYVYASDPEGFRILQFDSTGGFIRYWGEFGSELTGFNLPTGLATDEHDHIWVVDTGNHRVLRFSPPSVTTADDDS
jgi:predicted membrane-bound mannosyltransferase/DNA-binding beta-propeller fold protein YncE